MKEQREGHTPIPWHVTHQHATDGRFDIVSPHPHGGSLVANAYHCEANARFIVEAVNQHERLAKVSRKLVEHGFCPACGCDQWNTKGCPICPTMREAYEALVSLGEREPRMFAAYAEPDETNLRNMIAEQGKEEE